MDYNAAKIFTYVVNNGSFSGASKELGIPVSTVSRKVSELEEQLQSRLLERSTRQLRLTDSGSTFFEFASRSLEALNLGLQSVQDQQEELSGSLRLELPPNFEPWWFVIHDFQKLHPNVNIKVAHSATHLDFIEDGLDVAIRFGEIKSETVIARKIATSQRKLVASPEFIAKYGEPKDIDDLKNFRCLVMSDIHSETYWELNGQQIKITPYSVSSDFQYIRYMTLNAQGIGNLPPGYYLQGIKEGTLVPILEDYEQPIADVFVTYPSRNQLSRITRAFIDFSIEYAEKNQNNLWLVNRW